MADLFFERAAGVSDLPALDALDSGLRPIIAGGNPFLQNIRMENTTLTARRDNWIRSEQMNVELEGEVDLLYDRQTQDLALVGDLQAVRGSLGFGPRGLRKQFQVDGGTVRFLGTPGLNPDLDLTASEPVRTPEGDRLTIIAEVTGTLVSPRVALRSDEVGFTEDDLLSYLWFGRPTYALTSDQSEAVGAGLAVGLNTLSSGLGTVMTQGLGLDFLGLPFHHPAGSGVAGVAQRQQRARGSGYDGGRDRLLRGRRYLPDAAVPARVGAGRWRGKLPRNPFRVGGVPRVHATILLRGPVLQGSFRGLRRVRSADQEGAGTLDLPRLELLI